MKRKDIIIVGGGPAGLAAAISACRTDRHKQVLLLEANAACGIKLLISGAGQCNFTHNLPVQDFLKRCGENANYLKKAYYNFDKDAFIQLLETAGCPSFAREDGKVFPVSLRATDVRDTMLQLALQAGAEVAYGAKVEGISSVAGGFKLEMQDGGSLMADKLIIAAGGASYPQTGSDGKLLAPLKSLGHAMRTFKPHLGSVNIEDFGKFTACAGISLSNVRASFRTKDDNFSASGDLLITHTGLSGPLILDNCYRLAKNSEIVIRWVPNAIEALQHAVAKYPKMNVLNALCELPVPKSLMKVLLEQANIDHSRVINTLNHVDLMLITTMLSYTQFQVSAVEKLSTAMASSGGVPLSEINAKSMQSRLCPGLYLAGEIMDYNLPSGGFNIQMAVSTGWMAGAMAAKGN